MKNLSFVSKVILVSLVALQSFVANAEVLGTLVSDVSMVDLVVKFRLNPKSGKLEMNQTNSQIIGGITGTGKLSSLKQVINKQESRVIGFNIKGSATVRLEEKGNSLFMIHDTSVDDIVDATTVKYSNTMVVEVSLTKGTIAEYKQGKTIEFKPTDLGKAAIVAAESKVHDDLTKTALKQQLAGYNVTSKLIRTKVSDNIRYQVDQSEIVVFNPSTGFVTEFTVSR